MKRHLRTGVAGEKGRSMAEAPARYCSNCGNELRPEDQVCQNCGTPVHRAATVPTPEADVPVPPPPQAGGSDAAAAQATPQNQTVVNVTTQQVAVTQPKSMRIAYALWFFLGQLGLHRIYLGRVGSGVAQLLLGLVGWATVWFVIGVIPLAILWIWLFVDLFLTASMVREANRTITAAVG
jgi:TM2 domain-containing membrane protein YozV